MPGAGDFSASAARLTDLQNVRGALILSHDGLTLAAHPSEREVDLRGVWDRLRAVGNPDRGFLANRDETWMILRSEGYTAVVVGTREVSPGLVLDHMERALVPPGGEDAGPAAETAGHAPPAANGNGSGPPPWDPEEDLALRADPAMEYAPGPDPEPEPAFGAEPGLEPVLGHEPEEPAPGEDGADAAPMVNLSAVPMPDVPAIHIVPNGERVSDEEAGEVGEDEPAMAAPLDPAVGFGEEESVGEPTELASGWVSPERARHPSPSPDGMDPVDLVREFKDLFNRADG